MIFTYTSFVSTGWGLIACTNPDPVWPFDATIDVTTKTLIADADVYCNSNSYTLWMNIGYAILLVYCICIPGGMFWFLYRRVAQNLDDDENKNLYGFIYDSYTEKYWFWEALVLARKFLFATAATFGASWGFALQSLFCILVIFVFSCSQLMFKPYEDQRGNRIDSIGLSTSFFMLISSSFINGGDIATSGIQIIFSWIIVVSLFSFGIYIFYTLFIVLRSEKSMKLRLKPLKKRISSAASTIKHVLRTFTSSSGGSAAEGEVHRLEDGGDNGGGGLHSLNEFQST